MKFGDIRAILTVKKYRLCTKHFTFHVVPTAYGEWAWVKGIRERPIRASLCYPCSFAPCHSP